MNLTYLLDENILTDVSLTLTDSNTEITDRFHKIIMYHHCNYFRKLFLTNFKEKDLDIFSINVPNAHVCYDIIRSFYGDKSNLASLPNWQYQLEYIRCCDFLAIPLDLSNYTDLIVPIEGILSLLEVADLTNYPTTMIKILTKNIPEDYNLDDKLAITIKKFKNNRLISCGKDFTIKIWQADTGDLINTLKGHTNSVYSVSFSPDGKTIVSGSMDQSIIIWDAVTCKNIRTLKGHTNEIRGVTFSPNGKTIASASLDKSVIVWDIVNGQIIHTLKGHDTSIFVSLYFLSVSQ